ncbi:antibiotic biosynthesis monooxygenase family protein [Deinococcus aquiradiocola]|uniref:Antibiotic biosynthesis monooxygenase n=1 Tax=Deinococcus aquiradiocola TaxID=393059 RepID=A0A917UIM2_9DEIO|nr:antibiotic biosynthesis monooxygenase [Deinococcus aquiradiocola]GGJ60378.1 antibiotic biosynthesis monooxygenase [Deinococcus aquiradiocola]
MITVMNRIAVNPDYAEQFEERFQNRARMVDDMPGFVSNQVLRPTTPDDPYIVLTVWESREHFDAWTRSDAFVQGHARSGTLPKEAFSGPNRLELHEVLQDSARPDLKPEPRGKPLGGH